MKKFRTQIQSIILILSTIILFQGCGVYKSTTVSLEIVRIGL